MAERHDGEVNEGDGIETAADLAVYLDALGAAGEAVLSQLPGALAELRGGSLKEALAAAVIKPDPDGIRSVSELMALLVEGKLGSEILDSPLAQAKIKDLLPGGFGKDLTPSHRVAMLVLGLLGIKPSRQLMPGEKKATAALPDGGGEGTDYQRHRAEVAAENQRRQKELARQYGSVEKWLLDQPRVVVDGREFVQRVGMCELLSGGVSARQAMVSRAHGEWAREHGGEQPRKLKLDGYRKNQVFLTASGAEKLLRFIAEHYSSYLLLGFGDETAANKE